MPGLGLAARVCLLATLYCEPRQAWKGAAAAVDTCVGVRRARVASYLISLISVALQLLPRSLTRISHQGARWSRRDLVLQ